MKILFISQLFDPEYSIKGLELMRHLKNQGHEVEVITTYPNYPTGKIFDGYKAKLISNQNIDGIKITRVWSYISHSKSKISRALTYLSFTFMALLKALSTKRPDIIYAYHPQTTTGIIGIILRFSRKIPFITDVQDLWPDSLISTGIKKNGLIIKIISFFCNLIYKKSDKIIVLSNGFKETLIKRGVSEDKITVIYNWCPEEEKINEVLNENKKNTKYPGIKTYQIVYAGNIGAAQSLKSVIDAMANLKDLPLKLKIIGNGVEKKYLEEYTNKNNLSNIEFSGYIPSKQLFAELIDSDLLIVHLKKDPLFKITIPSKTQSSMAMGKPIVMAVDGETADLIKQADCGVIAEPENPNSISNAIREVFNKKNEWEKLGENSKNFYYKNLSMKIGFEKVNTVINSIRI